MAGIQSIGFGGGWGGDVTEKLTSEYALCAAREKLRAAHNKLCVLQTMPPYCRATRTFIQAKYVPPRV